MRERSRHGFRGRGEAERGNALVLVLVVLVLMTPLMVALLGLADSRAKVESRSSAALLRAYAAEAGLTRAKFMVERRTNRALDESWLRDNASTDPDALTPVVLDGADVFTHSGGLRGEAEVRVFVLELTPTVSAFHAWYLVIARAESLDPDGTRQSYSLAQTMRSSSSFAKYARFVSSGNLSIGAGAQYFGEVHSNGNISPDDSVVFHEDTSASGSISGNATFHKDKREGIDIIEPPSEAGLRELVTAAPTGSATVYDTDDEGFRNQFAQAMNITPSEGDAVEVHVTWKGDVMDVDVRVEVGGTWHTWSQTDQPIPMNGLMFVNGDLHTSGDFASRVTVAVTDTIHITDPLRYTNSAGEGQYTLYENGVPSHFDDAQRQWTATGDWRQPPFEYRETDGWVPPTAGGIAFNPSLGLVALNDLNITAGSNIQANGEYHAAFFSADGTVVSHLSGGQKRNLYMLGAMITNGSMNMSGAWRFRNYVYDTRFLSDPPPNFPTTDQPSAKNWHELGTASNDDDPETFRILRSNVKSAFGLGL